MYTNWEDFFTPFISMEEYIPNNVYSKNLNNFLFFLILGFIVSFTFIAKVENKADNLSVTDPLLPKIEQTKKDLNTIESKNAALESEIFILNHYLTGTLESREKQELLNLSKLTGTHQYIGPGIIIKLSDNNKSVKEGENPNLGIIHDMDLVELVNNLWTAKAEAISINGERITSLTGINCVGSAIMINKSRIFPPFVIKAIGTPEKLSKIIENGYMKTLNSYGIKYFIEKYNRLELPPNGNIILSGDF